MPKDTLFEGDQPKFESFEFSPSVAEVFDDMVARSVPGYDEVQDLLVQLALRHHRDQVVYDLGCSTGTTLQRLSQAQAGLRLVGVDRSEAMLAAAREKLVGAQVELLAEDIESPELFRRGRPGVVILCLVLQFLRPVRRQELLRRFYQELAPGGCLLVVEKTVQADPRTNALFIELYHDFKRRNGYSQQEIARKREALENRLIPFQPEENLEMLRLAGCPQPCVFYSWLNFQGYLASKL